AGCPAPKTTPIANVGGLPLTPALSPDGGEGAGARWAFASRARFRLLLPLGGEGRDEGVGRHRKRRQLQVWAACPLTPALSPDGGEGAEARWAFASRARFRLLLPL